MNESKEKSLHFMENKNNRMEIYKVGMEDEEVDVKLEDDDIRFKKDNNEDNDVNEYL